MKNSVKSLPWKRVPAGLRYLRAHGLAATWRRIFPRSHSYTSWIDAYDGLRPADIVAIEKHIQSLPTKPLLSIILLIEQDCEPNLRETVGSVVSQLYPAWELCISASPRLLHIITNKLSRIVQDDHRVKFVSANPGSSLGSTAGAGLSGATGAFVLFLNPADKLAPHALYMIAVAVCQSESVDIIYSDEDAIDRLGNRSCPKFKSDWNPDLFLSCNLIGRLAAYRRRLVEKVGGFRTGFGEVNEYDLALRVVEQTKNSRIHHIPMILYHRRGAEESGTDDRTEDIRQVLEGHLARSQVAGVVVPTGRRHMRVHYPIPVPQPGVSIIVPTRDHVDLLFRCIDGLLSKTDYDNIEIIIVDNGSILFETQTYFKTLGKQTRIKIINFPGLFNFSAINNFAAKHATHEIIGFLNNDIEVIHEDWLQEMVSQAIRPEIGAVGAKLFYYDNTIQHGGTIIGLGGLAGHAFRHFNREDAGYMHRLQLTQNVSAVTAACMLLRKEVFEEAGGFDAVNLPVAYNDVDLCLRVRERGYRNVWTPYAALYHHESGSRPSDYSPERLKKYRLEMNYLKSRWKDVIQHDPCYNPNLTVETEDFALAYPPRVARPWGLWVN